MMKPLADRSLPELEAAKSHLQKIERQMEEDAKDFPGPGWDAVRDLLDRNRAELEDELTRRYS